nr:hypothetical protein [Anaerolineae bacterium]
GIALTGWPPLPATVRGDWTIPTGWTLAADVPPETYSVAFHLMQGDTFITGSDAGLPGRRFGLLAHTLALADVPPGTYGLHLVVYAWRSGARLTLTRADGTTGTSLLLGTVQVTR